MYVLFNDRSKAMIAICDDKRKALAIARMTSREGAGPIVCIFNKPTGATAVCFRIESGEQTFDGGCCTLDSTAA